MAQPSLDPLEQPTLVAPPKAFVRELCDGQAVDSVFVVRDRTRRLKKNGDPFLKLRLADVTGTCEAVMWDGVDDSFAACAVGAPVRVAGAFSVDSRYGATLTLRALRAADEVEYEPADLHDASPLAFDQMVADLRSLITTVQSPPLRALLRRFFADDSEVWARWSRSPAAKHYHQAYRHGLLEHSLGVGEAVAVISTTFPGICLLYTSPSPRD